VCDVLCEFLVFGLWYGVCLMLYGIWCMIYCEWLVYGVWRMMYCESLVYGVWCMVGAWRCMVYSV